MTRRQENQALQNILKLKNKSPNLLLDLIKAIDKPNLVKEGTPPTPTPHKTDRNIFEKMPQLVAEAKHQSNSTTNSPTNTPNNTPINILPITEAMGENKGRVVGTVEIHSTPNE